MLISSANYDLSFHQTNKLLLYCHLYSRFIFLRDKSATVSTCESEASSHGDSVSVLYAGVSVRVAVCGAVFFRVRTFFDGDHERIIGTGKPEIPANAQVPLLVTLFGIVTEVRLSKRQCHPESLYLCIGH